MSLRRVSVVALAAALMVGLVPAAGAQSACESSIIIFSRAGVFMADGSSVGHPTLDPRLTACDVDPSLDGRYIYPHANMVRIRYTLEFGPDIPTIPAHMSGLGIEQDVVLTRTTTATGGVFMEGPWLPITPAQTGGTITAVVTLPEGSDPPTESETYRTVL